MRSIRETAYEPLLDCPMCDGSGRYMGLVCPCTWYHHRNKPSELLYQTLHALWSADVELQRPPKVTH
jgi:hypothetical protein